MNRADQIIAIAKACGWVIALIPRDKMLSKIPAWHFTNPSGITVCSKEVSVRNASGDVDIIYVPFEGELNNWIEAAKVPDYLNDLNAMHKAEEILTDEQVEEYVTILCLEVQQEPKLWHATAAQRAEAFLKTLNLWKP